MIIKFNNRKMLPIIWKNIKKRDDFSSFSELSLKDMYIHEIN